MKTTPYFKIALILFVSTSFSCSKEEDNVTLPFESYRYDLWKQLIDDDRSFDFIGTQLDSYQYPDYLGNSFDREHEGVGSIETDGVLINLRPVLSITESAEIVLLGIGTNDLVRGDLPQDIIKNVVRIIGILQRDNPNVTIFIEKIAPLHSAIMSTDLRQRTEAFNNLVDHIASRNTVRNQRIISVDMYTDFLDSYLDDGIHYNLEGANFIASKYMEAIQNHFEDNQIHLNILPLGDSRVVGLKYD